MDNLYGLINLFNPDDQCSPDITGISHHNIKLHLIISSIAVVSPRIHIQPPGSGHRSYQIPLHRLFSGEIANTFSSSVDSFIFNNGLFQSQHIFFNFGQGFLNQVSFGQIDIPSYTPDDDHSISFPIAGQTFGQPHYFLPYSPGLHKNSIKADEVAGHSQPHQVGMKPLYFQHNCSDKLSSPWNFKARSCLDSLSIIDRMH